MIGDIVTIVEKNTISVRNLLTSFPEKLDTFPEKLDTFPEKLDILLKKLDILCLFSVINNADENEDEDEKLPSGW